MEAYFLKPVVFAFCRDTGQSDSDSFVYSFDMSSLSDLLRRQAEQNRSASHFNIDILKYQVCQEIADRFSW